MEGFGPRFLILLAATAVVMAATPVGAEVYKRTASDGTIYFTNIQPNPSHQRAVFTPAPARSSQRPASADHGVYAQEIAEAAARYAVPERLIWAVIRVESGFDHRAVSRTGARGLMQLMPETAAILGVRDSFDPMENINGGVRHLRGLLDRFGNDLPLVLAAYNAGEGAVNTYRGIPPYPETQSYVQRVLDVGGLARTSGRGQEAIYRSRSPDGALIYS